MPPGNLVPSPQSISRDDKTTARQVGRAVKGAAMTKRDGAKGKREPRRINSGLNLFRREEDKERERDERSGEDRRAKRPKGEAGRGGRLLHPDV